MFLTSIDSLKYNIDKEFQEQTWDHPFVISPPLKQVLTDKLINDVPLDYKNLALLTSASVVVYKILYESEEAQKMIVPESMKMYAGQVNFLKIVDNELSQKPQTYPSEFIQPALISTWDTLIKFVINALNIRFNKKEPLEQYKYYTTIYRYLKFVYQHFTKLKV